MIELEQAQQLVHLLECGKKEEANALLVAIYKSKSAEPMFQQIGELTRELHESIKEFTVDERMSEIATAEIPDAKDRLQYVITKTEVAANKTMDAVDRCMPIADQLHQTLLDVRPQWNELMKGRIALDEFKALCHRIDDLLSQIEGDSSELRGELMDILMAQDFQDLTGQIIRRVITLVNEVEQRLVDILTVFGTEQSEQQEDNTKHQATAPEGPILNPHERSDAVSSQDEVDDLLSSLGF
ncbi:protein phosphatase CheZ [Vibrio spartinae]|uniref:Protein phosphatase CheZ n=1 Tax=Vibrio spartinae TaxID=1918945 RepID=A0A1N6M0F2_9VIBR|nr:protein phosphatase CheZ [Vibrio spartinae]QMV15050.1 chemotaxis regulator CheZ [Vibrio spartinae]SIO92918.1 chemotaxis regulator CheZ [Vibrio spartinae]